MVQNMFKVNNENTITGSRRCFYYKISTYFTPLSSASIVDFEQVNVNWGNYYLLKVNNDNI